MTWCQERLRVHVSLLRVMIWSLWTVYRSVQMILTVLKRWRITHKQTHDSPVSKGRLFEYEGSHLSAAASRGQFIISKYTVCTVCAHDGVTFLIISTACICSLLFSFICAGGLSSHNKLRVAGNRLIKALICSHSPPLADSIYLPALPCLIHTNSIITLLEWEPIQDQYLSTNIPLIVFSVSVSFHSVNP